MTSPKVSEQLLIFVDSKWRSKIEGHIRPLKQWNEKKCNKCVDDILKTLRDAIIDDRNKFPQRFERFKEYFKFGVEMLMTLALVVPFVYITVLISAFIRRLTGFFGNLSESELFRLMSENSSSVLCIVIIFSVVGAIVLGVVFLKFFGSETHTGDVLKTIRSIFKLNDLKKVTVHRNFCGLCRNKDVVKPFQKTKNDQPPARKRGREAAHYICADGVNLNKL